MPLIAWLVLGLVAGYLSSKIVNKTGEDFSRTLYWVS